MLSKKRGYTQKRSFRSENHVCFCKKERKTFGLIKENKYLWLQF